MNDKLIIYALNFLKANIDDDIVDDLGAKGELELEDEINSQITIISND